MRKQLLVVALVAAGCSSSTSGGGSSGSTSAGSGSTGTTTSVSTASSTGTSTTSSGSASSSTTSSSASSASGSSGSSSSSGSVSATGGSSGSTIGGSGSIGGSSGSIGGSSGSIGGSTGSTGGCAPGPNDDFDQDGFTIAQGDCDDCNAAVNPGAIDVLHDLPDGGQAYGDEDCSGSPGDLAGPCDQALALTDTDPTSGAKSLGLCAFATQTDARPGVISARYVRADGSPMTAPGAQVGLSGAFGSNVFPQEGSTLLVLSTGAARTPAQQGACTSASCSSNASGTPPPGFPIAASASCPISSTIADDVALELTLRAPTNAVGFSFDYAFYSFEFPVWACTDFNDEFVALMSPPPPGALSGDIALDSAGAPINATSPDFEVCNPSTQGDYAAQCSGFACPSAPSPYCPLGPAMLAGTGFDSLGEAGATGWRTATAPVTGGATFTLRLAIWDSGDQTLDSTVLLDNFRWATTP